MIFILCLLQVTNGISNVHNSKASGYPEGLIADCPGSTKEARIKRESLKYLSFLVLGKGSILTQTTQYNYFQMNDLPKNPVINFKKKTILFVNGYLDSGHFMGARLMGTVYKSLGYNVLLLEMSRFTTIAYPLSARFMRPVGKHVAEMLVNLTKQGLNPKKLELIGLSLGGHTVSFIGKSFQMQTGIKIGRITGLDPAGPCYRNLGPKNRLDRTDADFVDVIHTNIDGYGMPTALGHVDFYVNGGEFQPGEISFLPCSLFCSHIRSYSMWLAALLEPGFFIGMKCDSVEEARKKMCYDKSPMITNVLGPTVDRNRTGIFYLATSNFYPYYMGEKGLLKENDYYAVQMKALDVDVAVM